MSGAQKAVEEAGNRLKHCRKAALETAGTDPGLVAEAEELQRRLEAITTLLDGDRTISSRSEPAPLSISERVNNVVGNQWNTTSAPTRTERDAYRHAGAAFSSLLGDLRELVEKDLSGLESRLEAAGAPWTPGRIPDWTIE